jgi:ribonuclease R
MEANLVAVVERGRSTLLGHYRESTKRAWVVPKDKDILPPIEVERKAGVPDGALVAVDLGRHPGIIKGTIAAVWTDPDAPASLIEQLVYERDLPREFPVEVLREVDRLPDSVPREEADRREDLRGLEVIVIDPADARDHDDAVSWEPRPGGGGRLGVHIADVSWYVRPGSALDGEARARGVSVYLTDRVLPMLPLRISADLCSLIAGKDRLALSVLLDLDREANIQHGDLRETVIRPAVSLSYEEAWAVMQDKRSRHPNAKSLHALHAITEKLRARRFAAGCLDFNFPETKVLLGDDGEPAEIRQRMGDPSHWLVEECMIAANTWTGEQLARAGRGIWRVHEPPSMEDVAELEEFLKGMGVKLRRGPTSRDLHPKDFQAVLERFKGEREEYVVHRKVLQALRLAVYSAENLGHFGLALKTYTHFTSPIRRYADLLVHRMLRPNGPDGRYTVRALGELAGQTSALERRAQEGEWACTKLMVLRYLAKRVGETFDGTVSRVERYGAFVDLDGIGQGGLVPQEQLGLERFQVARDGLSMRGGRSGHMIRVGQRVKVIIVRVDPACGFLDLALD